MTIRRRRRALGTTFAVVMLGAGVLRDRVRRYEVAEQSMEPALTAGDYLVAVRRDTPRRGSLVIYPLPGSPDFEVIKRVVGLPGETVEIADGHVHADGEVLYEPWADGPTHPNGSWALGPRQLFVLGDSRALSAGDSRSLGPIGLDAAGWRAVWRYWPPRSFGRL